MIFWNFGSVLSEAQWQVYSCALPVEERELRAMSELPNQYTRKLVAESDAKLCLICYKPSSTVLLNSSNMDFFYVCPQHLKDEQFAKAMHSEEYKETNQKKTELEAALIRKRKRLEELKPGWSFWKIGTNKMERKQRENETKDLQSDNNSEPQDTKETYDSVQQEVKDLQGKLKNTNEWLANYRPKQYALDSQIYKMLLLQRTQGRVRAKQQREKLQEDIFPEVPKNRIQ